MTVKLMLGLLMALIAFALPIVLGFGAPNCPQDYGGKGAFTIFYVLVFGLVLFVASIRSLALDGIKYSTGLDWNLDSEVRLLLPHPGRRSGYFRFLFYYPMVFIVSSLCLLPSQDIVVCGLTH